VRWQIVVLPPYWLSPGVFPGVVVVVEVVVVGVVEVVVVGVVEVVVVFVVEVVPVVVGVVEVVPVVVEVVPWSPLLELPPLGGLSPPMPVACETALAA
jgi:hypothetical protein